MRELTRKEALEIMLDNWICDGEADYYDINPQKISGPEYDEDMQDWVYYYSDGTCEYMICDDGSGNLAINYLASIK